MQRKIFAIVLTLCFKYDAFFDVFCSLTVISWITLILSTWNSIRCQRNFGLHLGQFREYCKFNLLNTPSLFDSIIYFTCFSDIIALKIINKDLPKLGFIFLSHYALITLFIHILLKISMQLLYF
ncbi:hypothetical protein GLOIN_2v1501908 [Rhizophagus irregularis DAOM 181602=DAOM 197198]|nr:hypothetical protein GLOIN_2v1501908 [Rhizophagus irregularis DAOM 181602=DAOM 197198]